MRLIRITEIFLPALYNRGRITVSDQNFSDLRDCKDFETRVKRKDATLKKNEVRERKSEKKIELKETNEYKNNKNNNEKEYKLKCNSIIKKIVLQIKNEK